MTKTSSKLRKLNSKALARCRFLYTRYAMAISVSSNICRIKCQNVQEQGSGIPHRKLGLSTTQFQARDYVQMGVRTELMPKAMYRFCLLPFTVKRRLTLPVPLVMRRS
jgi:hypothetical protein